MTDACSHLDEVADVTPSSDGCAECLRVGGSWVHLRHGRIMWPRRLLRQLAQRHATAHFTRSVISSSGPTNRARTGGSVISTTSPSLVDDAPSFEYP
jgi:hypothetical protein